MNKASHAAHYLASLGLVANEGKATAALQEVLDSDYIPGGHTSYGVKNICPAPPGTRCGVRMGNDIQSGPFFCGDPATLMGVDCDDGAPVLVCKGHEHVMRSMEKS